MNLSEDFCNVLYELARKHNGENIETIIEGIPLLIIQKLEDADYVLRLNANNYIKNMNWFRQVMGPSRMSENGEAWRFRMELTQPYFSKFDREAVFQTARRTSEAGLAHMTEQSSAGRKTIDDTLLRKMSSATALEIFFDMSLEETGINLDDLARLMEYGSQYAFVPSGKTTEHYKEALRNLPDLRRRVLVSLEKFRKIDAQPGTMLGDIQQAHRGRTMGFRQEHELVTLFAASTETTGASLGWLCYALARHPDIQEQLRIEIRKFLQLDSPDWNSFQQIRIIQSFISEVLRLYPPTPVIAQQSLSDDRIGDHEVKAGQNILISFVGIQHDQRMRKDPWELDISDPASACPVSGKATSFSFGPRVCGGKHFALVEIAGFLCTFLDKARFELTSETPPRYRWKSQMVRDGGHPVAVSPL